jgi:hypothetical protein
VLENDHHTLFFFLFFYKFLFVAFFIKNSLFKKVSDELPQNATQPVQK